MFRSKNSPDPEPPPTFREQLAAAFLQLRFVVYLVLVFCLILLGFVWQRVFITVPAGHNAVMYRFLAGGTVTDRVWGEGLHVIPPWDRLTLYDTRLQQRTLNFNVLSEEGLQLGVKVSIRFRPQLEMLGFLQRDIGKEYFDKLVLPEIQAHTRRTFGNRPAHEIYSSAKDVLQELGRLPVLGRVEDMGGNPNAMPYVVVQELKLMDISLPDMVAGAIADKYRQEQLMLEYRYKLEREEKEAERKRTEAAGIRDYNEIVGKLSPEVLRLKSIEATLELSRSPNSKVVLLGGGQQGQGPSLIMNLEGPPPAAAASPAAATAPPPRLPPGDTGGASTGKTTPTVEEKPLPANGARPTPPSPTAGTVTPTRIEPPAESRTAPTDGTRAKPAFGPLAVERDTHAEAPPVPPER
ncbi:prohibitin family protein [Melittangium boletus]|uniref:prohibitin family protein n=1 Tax=Melittangium boletus TaxID=83453 RepID=UPI003DA6CD1B